jgi:hypothetical protein
MAAAKMTTNSAARRAEDSRMRGGAVMRKAPQRLFAIASAAKATPFARG